MKIKMVDKINFNTVECDYEISSGSKDLLLVNSKVMLVAPDQYKFMGEFTVKNLITNRWYFSYWLDLPPDVFKSINDFRIRKYDMVTDNSEFVFVLKIIVKENKQDWDYKFLAELQNQI